MTMQPPAGAQRDLKKFTPMSPEEAAAMSPSDKLDKLTLARRQLADSINGQWVRVLLDALRNGCELEGKFVEKPAIEDLVVQIIHVDQDAYLGELARKALQAQKKRVVFLLRDRLAFAEELRVRILDKIPETMGNRAERRAVEKTIPPQPWAKIAEKLSQPVLPSCHWVVVHWLGTTCIPGRFDEAEYAAGLAKWDEMEAAKANGTLKEWQAKERAELEATASVPSVTVVDEPPPEAA